LPKKFEIYIKFGMKNLNKLRNYKSVANKVKKIFEKRLGKIDVYVFGSLIEGKPTALSDIDVLVVTEDDVSREEIYMLKTEAYKTIEAPMELHVVSSKDFENWYKRFITKMEKIA